MKYYNIKLNRKRVKKWRKSTFPPCLAAFLFASFVHMTSHHILPLEQNPFYTGKAIAVVAVMQTHMLLPLNTPLLKTKLHSHSKNLSNDPIQHTGK